MVSIPHGMLGRGAPAGREQQHGSESGSQQSERRQREAQDQEEQLRQAAQEKLRKILSVSNILVGGDQEGMLRSASPENRH